MNEIFVDQLSVCPIKSCQGISLDEVKVTETGFEYDREWMLVHDNPETRFITQRERTELAAVRVSLDDDQLRVQAPSSGAIMIDLAYKQNQPMLTTSVFENTCAGYDEGDEVAFFFSDYLKTPVRLIRASKEEPRFVNPTYQLENTINRVNFGDGFPFLLTSQVSLEYLNTLKSERIPMNRFRANVVVDGDLMPFEEDEFANASLGQLEANVRRACARCAIPTIVQSGVNAGDDTGTPILRDFLDVRKGWDMAHPEQKKGRFFGQNLLHFMGTEGVIVKRGDPVNVTYNEEPNVKLRSAT